MPRRSITTECWVDDSFADLPANAKLAFFRLITGPEVNACGAVHLTRRSAAKIAPDLPVTPDEFEGLVLALADADLVRTYPEDWLWLPAWIRHNVGGAGMILAARRAAATLPDSLRRAVTRELDKHVGTSQTKPVPEQEQNDQPRRTRHGTTPTTTTDKKPPHKQGKPGPSPPPSTPTSPPPSEDPPGRHPHGAVEVGKNPLRGVLPADQDQETGAAAPTARDREAAAAARDKVKAALTNTRGPFDNPRPEHPTLPDDPAERRAGIAARLHTPDHPG